MQESENKNGEHCNISGYTHEVISPINVANNFLVRGMKTGVEINVLKLQRLVYLLYKDYLKETGNSLFTDTFETWKSGPIIPSIYNVFSPYGMKPIKSLAPNCVWKSYIVAEKGVFRSCIDCTWDKYSWCSAERLSELTRTKGSAWDKARERKDCYLALHDIKEEADYTPY